MTPIFAPMTPQASNRALWDFLTPIPGGSRVDHRTQEGSSGPTKNDLLTPTNRPYDPNGVIDTKSFYDQITLKIDAISSLFACNRIEPTWITLLQLLISARGLFCYYHEDIRCSGWKPVR